MSRPSLGRFSPAASRWLAVVSASNKNKSRSAFMMVCVILQSVLQYQFLSCGFFNLHLNASCWVLLSWLARRFNTPGVPVNDLFSCSNIEYKPCFTGTPTVCDCLCSESHARMTSLNDFVKIPPGLGHGLLGDPSSAVPIIAKRPPGGGTNGVCTN